MRYVCPSCKHVQQHGGQCEQCGLDFLKYAMVLQSQMQLQADQERQRMKSRTSILKQILLLPITGGLSLLGYLRSRLRGQ